MAKLTDSMDVTSTGIRIVGPRRVLLVGTRQGGARLVGTLSNPSPWVRQPFEGVPGPVHDLAVHPETGHLLLAVGGERAGLWTQAGDLEDLASWTRVEGWPEGAEPTALALSGRGRMLAGEASGRLFSADLREGAAFAEAEAFAAQTGGAGAVTDLVGDPRRPGTWVANVPSTGAFHTQDDGHSWRRLRHSGASAVLPSGGSQMVAASAEGVEVSGDLGSSWTTASGIEGAVSALVRDAAGRLYAAGPAVGAARLAESVDEGSTWDLVSGAAELPAPSDWAPVLCTDGMIPSVYFFGASGQVWVRDGGGLRSLADDLPGIRRLRVA